MLRAPKIYCLYNAGSSHDRVAHRTGVNDAVARPMILEHAKREAAGAAT
jgi:hypothetical protein